ncbi:gamma-glutamyltranspeptidase 1 [Tanacetum coccineum]
MAGSSSQRRTDPPMSPIHAFPIEDILHGQMRKKLRCVKLGFTYSKTAALVMGERMLDFGVRFCSIWRAKHRSTVVKRQESRSSDEDYYAREIADYEVETGTTFKHRHCWEILKKIPKWMQIKVPKFTSKFGGGSKRYKSSGYSSFNTESGEASINLNTIVGDDEEDEVEEIRQPTDKDKAKDAAKKKGPREKEERLAFLEIKRREVECHKREFTEKSFDVVLDKAGLDALMEPQHGPAAGKLCTESSKQRGQDKWKIDIHVLPKKTSKNSIFRTFMVVAEKASSTTLQTICMSFARETLGSCEQTHGIFEALETKNRIRTECLEPGVNGRLTGFISLPKDEAERTRACQNRLGELAKDIKGASGVSFFLSAPSEVCWMKKLVTVNVAIQYQISITHYYERLTKHFVFLSFVTRLMKILQKIMNLARYCARNSRKGKYGLCFITNGSNDPELNMQLNRILNPLAEQEKKEQHVKLRCVEIRLMDWFQTAVVGTGTTPPQTEIGPCIRLHLDLAAFEAIAKRNTIEWKPSTKELLYAVHQKQSRMLSRVRPKTSGSTSSVRELRRMTSSLIQNHSKYEGWDLEWMNTKLMEPTGYSTIKMENVSFW